MQFNAIIIQFLRRTVAPTGILWSDPCVEAMSLLSKDNRLRIKQPIAQNRATGRQNFDERSENIAYFIHPLYKSRIGRQFGKPITQMTVSFVIDSFNLTVFIHNPKQEKRNYLFISKRQITVRTKSLAMNPKVFLIMFANHLIKSDYLRKELRSPRIRAYRPA